MILVLAHLVYDYIERSLWDNSSFHKISNMLILSKRAWKFKDTFVWIMRHIGIELYIPVKIQLRIAVTRVESLFEKNNDMVF